MSAVVDVFSEFPKLPLSQSSSFPYVCVLWFVRTPPPPTTSLEFTCDRIYHSLLTVKHATGCHEI